MSEENKYMDDCFRRMSEEFKVSYDSSMWNEAKSMLDDELMDEAFREAADSVVIPASFDAALSEMDDAFLDDAFKTAATEQQMAYDASYWEEFASKEADLHMSDAFNEAAQATVVPYNPAYWNDADAALQAEGLHYEYNSDYWKEAKTMLDLEDRRAFFFRWSGVATILLLISFMGGNLVNFTGSQQPNERFAKTETTSPVVLTEVEENAASFTVESENTAQISENNYPTHLQLEENVSTSEESSSHFIASSDETSSESVSTDESVAQSNDSESGIPDNGDQVIGVNVNEELSDDNGRTEEGVLLNPNNRFVQADERLMTIESVYQHEENLSMNTDLERLSMTNIENIENDRLMPGTAPQMVKIEKYTPRPMHSFSIIAGAGMGNEFGISVIDPNLRTYTGLEYTFNSFGKLKRFEFGMNVGVNQMRHSALGFDVSGIKYNFDGTSQAWWVKVRTTDMVYANAGLFAAYKLNNRHKIRFGVAYDRLIGVQSNMAHKDNRDAEIETVNNNWGIQNGINKDDIRLNIGYELKVNNRLGIQLAANYGFKDRTENIISVYGKDIVSESFDREMNVTLGLTYKLFRR